MDYSIYIIVWIVCGIASLLIAQGRGATNLASWFVVGVLLGPIGVVLALIGAKPPKGRKRDDAMSTLRGLAELRANGSLSEEEYEGKKRELLARL